MALVGQQQLASQWPGQFYIMGSGNGINLIVTGGVAAGVLLSMYWIKTKLFKL